MSKNNVNTGTNEGTEFDESQIPEAVRKSIEKEARHGYIPEERYNQSIGKLKDRLFELEKPPATPEAAPTKIYSHEELQGYVDAGQITEAQMGAQLNSQMTKQADARVDDKLAAQQDQVKANSIVEGYQEVIDDLLEPGSENRQKVEEAYEAVVAISGQPTDPLQQRKMEALALQQAFGPLKSLQKRTRDISNKARQSHQETAGTEQPGRKASDATAGIPQRLIDYNQRFVDKGSKTWDQVRDELKYVKSDGVKDRLGIK